MLTDHVTGNCNVCNESWSPDQFMEDSEIRLAKLIGGLRARSSVKTSMPFMFYEVMDVVRKEAPAFLPAKEVAAAPAAAPVAAEAAPAVVLVDSEPSLLVEMPLGDRRSHIETTILGIVQDMVSDSSMSSSTPFMDAGVDSLASTELVARLSKLTNLALPPTLLFEHGSARELGAHLLTELGAAQSAAAAAPAKAMKAPDADAVQSSASMCATAAIERMSAVLIACSVAPAARPGEGGHGAAGRGRGIEYAGGQPPPAPPPPSPPSSPPTEELEEEDMEQAQLAWNPRMEMVGARSEAQDPARLPSCLLAAAAHGDRAAVVAWLDGGGQVDAPCVLPDGSVRRESMLLEGLRMLTVASGNGHTQLVDVLLERKASVNLFDSQAQYYVGRGSPPHGSPTQGTTTTALMKAAQIGSASCVRRLLKAGACCNVLSLRGLRAHEVAAINGHCEVASIISQHISTLYINKHNAIVERELAEEALRRALEADELAALRTAVDAHAEAAGGKASAVLMLACERCDELVAEQRKARKQAEKKQRQEQKKREKEEATAKAKVEAEARAKAKAEAEEAMARQIQAEARAKAEAEARAKAEAARVKAEAARVKAAAEAAAAAAALEAAATAETAEAEDEEGGACAAEQATHLSQAIELRPAELRSATNSFAAASVIGRGAYGIVYVVTVLPSLPSSGAVAVKRLHNGGEGAQADLKREIDILSACHHAHTLPLLGYCFQSSCLVSPLCRGGSLEDRLFPSEEGSRRLAKLGFNTTPPLLLCFERVRIVCGAMRGLHYLHTCFAGGKPLVLHRDIKPANLLLSEQLDVYVADFGLAKGAPDQQGAAATPLSTVGVKGSASAAPGMTAPSHTLESTLTMCGCSLSLSLSRSICLHGPAVGAHGRPMLRADRQLCNGRDGTCGDARTACCWCAAALSPHVAHARRSGQVGGGHTARRECRRVAR
jgi:acyl carrier protein